MRVAGNWLEIGGSEKEQGEKTARESSDVNVKTQISLNLSPSIEIHHDEL